jgi:single-strand DNA-binding protein
MAKGVNKAILIGHVGREPEVKTSNGGVAFGNFSLATTEGRKDKDGKWVDHTEWHRVVVLGRLAEVTHEYIRKGAKVYIEGRLQTNKYTGKDGTEKQITEIVADDLQLLDRKQESANAPTRTPVASRPAMSVEDYGGVWNTPNDDIPF